MTERNGRYMFHLKSLKSVPIYFSWQKSVLVKASQFSLYHAMVDALQPLLESVLTKSHEINKIFLLFILLS